MRHGSISRLQRSKSRPALTLLDHGLPQNIPLIHYGDSVRRVGDDYPVVRNQADRCAELIAALEPLPESPPAAQPARTSANTAEPATAARARLLLDADVISVYLFLV